MKTILISLLMSSSVFAQTLDPLKDYRYCPSVVRDANGVIKRSSAVLTAFRKLHPCPSTGLKSGACEGWSINHNIPLACGGCDAVYNLSWLPNQIKSCADPWCVDRFERKINAAVPPIPDTSACTNVFPIDLNKQ